jgi:acyl carrier protein
LTPLPEEIDMSHPAISEIKDKIKEIIFETTNIDPSEIEDDDSFVDDLSMDSLTLLEIAVNIDQEFELDMPEEEMKQFQTVASSAEIVAERMAMRVG